MKALAPIFFRDDDLGWEDARFVRLLELFAQHGQKLVAAAIPREFASGLSPLLVQAFARNAAMLDSTLEVIAHGHAHTAHTHVPKKSEYPPEREVQTVAREFAGARERLQLLFGKRFFPAFVPPWNRIADAHLPSLKANGFAVLSRSGVNRLAAGSRLAAGIDEFNMSLDLHTLKTGPCRDVMAILKSINESAESPIGVMLHHTKMADVDFAVLDQILTDLRASGRTTVFLRDLVRTERT